MRLHSKLSRRLKKDTKQTKSSTRIRRPIELISNNYKISSRNQFRPLSSKSSKFRTTVTSNLHLQSTHSQANIEAPLKSTLEPSEPSQPNPNLKEKSSNKAQKEFQIKIGEGKSLGFDLKVGAPKKSPYLSRMDTKKFIRMYKNNPRKRMKPTKKREGILEKFSRLMEKKSVEEFIRQPVTKSKNRNKSNSRVKY